MGQLVLGEVVLAGDPVHDLQRAVAGAPPGRAGHERDEVHGLVRARADVQRVERQTGVADPGVAVVPVALPTHGFRERGRGGGDDRTSGPKGEAFEHARAHAHQLAMPARVDVVRGLPGAPRLDGVGDPRWYPVWRERLGRGSLGWRPLQREADPVAGRDVEGRDHRRILDRGGDAGADDDLIRAAEGPAAGLGRPKQRLDQPVFGPWRQLETQLHIAENPLD